MYQDQINPMKIYFLIEWIVRGVLIVVMQINDQSVKYNNCNQYVMWHKISVKTEPTIDISRLFYTTGLVL